MKAETARLRVGTTPGPFPFNPSRPRSTGHCSTHHAFLAWSPLVASGRIHKILGQPAAARSPTCAWPRSNSAIPGRNSVVGPNYPRAPNHLTRQCFSSTSISLPLVIPPCQSDSNLLSAIVSVRPIEHPSSISSPFVFTDFNSPIQLAFPVVLERLASPESLNWYVSRLPSHFSVPPDSSPTLVRHLGSFPCHPHVWTIVHLAPIKSGGASSSSVL